MKKNIYQVDAFTDVAFGGNPAGVMPHADGLTEFQMLKIAKEMNLSETAFVFQGGIDYDFEVRFFTPSEEVDLCGHATIATFSLLKELKLLPEGRSSLVQKTKAGKLQIKLLDDGSILMKQARPQKIDKALDHDFLNQIMGISHHELGLTGIMSEGEIWSTGLKDILLPIVNKTVLEKMVVDYNALSKLSKSLEVVGVHAFTITDQGEIWCRNFAPAYDIDEESATGTSNGALGACLMDKGYLTTDELAFVAHQGDWMASPSRINVKVIKGQDVEVWVGGKAVTVISGEIRLPSK